MKTILSLVLALVSSYALAGDCHVQLVAPLVQPHVVLQPQAFVVPHVQPLVQQQVVVPHVQQQVVVPQYVQPLVQQQVVVPHVQQQLLFQKQLVVPHVQQQLFVQKQVVPHASVRTVAPLFQRFQRSVVRQRTVVTPQRVVVRSVH